MLKIYNGAKYLYFRKRKLKSYEHTTHFDRDDIFIQYFSEGTHISFQEFQEFLYENNL